MTRALGVQRRAARGRVAGALLSLSLAAASLGCAHGLGPPPADEDLSHDGTPEARAYLYEKYRAELREGEVARPWAAERRSSARSEEAEAYLSTSPRAEAALDTLPVAVDRFTGSAAFPITLLAAGASVGVGVGLFVGLYTAASGATLAAGDVGLATGRDVGLATLYGGAAGLLASVPLSALGWWAAWAMAGRAARADYRRAVAAFNEDLEARIEGGYRPELVRPPSVSNSEDAE